MCDFLFLCCFCYWHLFTVVVVVLQELQRLKHFSGTSQLESVQVNGRVIVYSCTIMRRKKNSTFYHSIHSTKWQIYIKISLY